MDDMKIEGKVLRPSDFCGDVNGDFGYILNGVKSTNSYATQSGAKQALGRAIDKLFANQ